jgi:hypothetical protein
MGQLTFGFIDKSGEPASVGFSIPDLGAANVETYTDGGLSTAFDALQAAINGLTLLNPTGHTATAQKASVAPVRPTDANAQRETALLVKYADVNGHKGSLTVPGLDRTITSQDGTDEVPLTGITEVVALIDAIELYVVDSVTGLAVTVYSIREVGRNN